MRQQRFSCSPLESWLASYVCWPPSVCCWLSLQQYPSPDKGKKRRRSANVFVAQLTPLLLNGALQINKIFLILRLDSLLQNADIVIFICAKMSQKAPKILLASIFCEGKNVKVSNISMHCLAVCELFFHWNTAFERYFEVLSNAILQ